MVFQSPNYGIPLSSSPVYAMTAQWPESTSGGYPHESLKGTLSKDSSTPPGSRRSSLIGIEPYPQQASCMPVLQSGGRMPASLPESSSNPNIRTQFSPPLTKKSSTSIRDRRRQNQGRYKTTPITLDEIREADELTAQEISEEPRRTSSARSIPLVRKASDPETFCRGRNRFIAGRRNRSMSLPTSNSLFLRDDKLISSKITECLPPIPEERGGCSTPTSHKVFGLQDDIRKLALLSD